MEYLFSYGTLQHEDVQLKLFGRKLQGTPDILPDHVVMPVDITDEAFLAAGGNRNQMIAVRTPGKYIAGTVFEVSEEELKTADRYEPSNYKRFLVSLHSGKQAWVYAAV
ncbi:MAG TPA: gamma-glutamylcyclotransferase family protein [Flavisolibacter sp.]